MRELVGRTVDRYLVREYVGHGTFGAVYAAEHTGLGAVFALKRIHPPVRAGRSAEELTKEAKIAHKLDHPGIARARDCFEFNGDFYIVYDFVEGHNLEDVLTEPGIRLSPEQFFNYSLQILSTLSYAHNKGIVHRDIKQRNIIITPEGIAKITDFGLAAVVGDAALQGYYTSSSVTKVLSEDTRNPKFDVYCAGDVIGCALSKVDESMKLSYREQIMQSYSTLDPLFTKAKNLLNEIKETSKTKQLIGKRGRSIPEYVLLEDTCLTGLISGISECVESRVEKIPSAHFNSTAKDFILFAGKLIDDFNEVLGNREREEGKKLSEHILTQLNEIGIWDAQSKINKILDEVNGILDKACARRPEQRYSAKEFITKLTELQKGPFKTSRGNDDLAISVRPSTDGLAIYPEPDIVVPKTTGYTGLTRPIVGSKEWEEQCVPLKRPLFDISHPFDFVDLEWEQHPPSISRVDTFLYNDSQRRLSEKGYQRHPSSSELFSLLIAYFEGKLKTPLNEDQIHRFEPIINSCRAMSWPRKSFDEMAALFRTELPLAKVAKEILTGEREWLCQAAEINETQYKTKLIIYETVIRAMFDQKLKIAFETDKYTHKGLVYSGTKVFDISDLKPNAYYYFREIHKVHDDLITYLTTRSFGQLPEEIKKKGAILLPSLGDITLLFYCDLSLYCKASAAAMSRGVRIKQQ